MLQDTVKQLRVPEATGDFTPIGWHLSDVNIDMIFPPKYSVAKFRDTTNHILFIWIQQAYLQKINFYENCSSRACIYT